MALRAPLLLVSPVLFPAVFLGGGLAVLAACARSPAVRPPRHVPERFADVGTRPGRAAFEFPEAPPRDEAPAGPPVVARMEVVVPDRDTFVLHGTLPVPPGVWPRADGRTPLAVVEREPQGELVPAQVETVSRAPTGEADVVELSAPLRRPPGVEAGTRLRYAVVLGEFPLAGAPDVPPRSAALLDPGGPAPLLLRTRDVFDNRYEVDLRGAPDGPGFGSSRVLASGPAYRRRRTYSTLVPVGGGGRGGPLPHLMGVHAYLTEWAGDGRVGLELRVHNGATSGAAPETPEEKRVGIVYWDALELVLPEGWSVEPLVRDPFFGRPRAEDGRTVVPLVRPYPDGRLHMMGPQAQLHRRIALVPPGAPARVSHRPGLEGLAFCTREEGLWSWWNSATAGFFPQRSLLPHWAEYERASLSGNHALRARLGARLDELRRTLEGGEPSGGVMAGPLMGWAQPFGASVQGMTGGVGIQQFEGHRAAAAASAPGIEALMLEHRMNAARQPEAQWNRLGDPAGYHLWRDDEDRVPFDFRTHGRVVPPAFQLPCLGGGRVTHQVREVHLAGRRPPYDLGSPHLPDGEISGRGDSLLAWMPHDGQHLCRYTKNTKALVWLANDALAKDDLLLSAELFHLMFHEGEHEPASWSPGITLRLHEETVAAHPHQGMSVGRDHAWGIDAMCAAYSVADPEWRARNRSWFTRVARLFLNGAMESGLLQRICIPKILGGRYDASQAFECLFLLHAQRALIESVLRGDDDALAGELAALHQRSLEYLFWGPVWDCVPASYPPGASACGPRWHFAVAPAGGWDQRPFCDADAWGDGYLPEDGLDGGVENSYVWGPLEYGMLLAEPAPGTELGDRYLRRALDCGTGAGGFRELAQRLFADASRDSNDNSGNWAGFVGRLQTLGADGGR